MTNKTMRDRVVLVTGATGSLGSAVSRRFAEAGCSLALTGRSTDELEKLASELGISGERVITLAGDVSDEDFVRNMVEAVLRQMGGLHVLLNTVGGWSGGRPVQELSFENWKQALNTNLHTAFLLSKTALPPMIEAGWGRIIHVGAMTAKKPRANQAEYTVSKRALIALTEVIAEEVKGSQITSNLILPSIIDTPSNRDSFPGGDYHSWVKPEHIAEMMHVLCKEESASINGAGIEMYGSV